MIRVLVMIAVAGFFVSLVTLSSAIAIGGPEAVTDSAWSWGRGHWGSDGNYSGWSWSDDRGDHRGGPDGKRELAWTGGDTLGIDVPAEVTYTQAAGPAKLTVTGPQRALDDLVIEGGHLRYNHGHHHHWGGLSVVMTAPSVTHFDMSGSGKLAIVDYKQDKLALDLSGNAEVTASGEARAVALSASGSSETDLSGLKVADADIDLTGSGEAKLAPTGRASVNISGSGDVTLLSRPSRLESSVSGSGSIHQEDAAPPPPGPPAPPAKVGKKT